MVAIIGNRREPTACIWPGRDQNYPTVRLKPGAVREVRLAGPRRAEVFALPYPSHPRLRFAHNLPSICSRLRYQLVEIAVVTRFRYTVRGFTCRQVRCHPRQ